MTLLDTNFLAFIAAQVGDYYTTYVIVVKQGGRERIAWLAWLIDKLGLIPALVLAKGVAAGAGYYLYAVEPSPYILGALTAAYSWQVYQNAIRMK